MLFDNLSMKTDCINILRVQSVLQYETFVYVLQIIIRYFCDIREDSLGIFKSI